MLIVVAIIGILATLLLSAMSSARQRSQVAACRAHLRAIQIALSAYEADHGKYPRLTGRTGTDPWQDDAPALYAGLMNRPTRDLGGGANSPYLTDWKAENVGFLQRAFLQPDNMGNDGSNINGSGVTFLDPTQYDMIRDPTFQQTNNALSAAPLALLDPWGNPIHFREWASLRNSVKDGFSSSPASRTITPPSEQAQQGSPPVAGPVLDRPHASETFDIWSNGPNGINEFGDPDSDDVSSWSDDR